MQRFQATYRIETPLPLEDAAAMLAGEQSSGTFVPVPGESEALKARFAARVESITPGETVTSPSLPGGRLGDEFEQAEVTVSWPVENVGPNLPTLVSTVQGNLYELRGFTGIKLIDLDLPAELTKAFRGPAHGIAGTRQLAGVEGRR